MREMTDADLARVRRAVVIRERCIRAAVADGQRLDIRLSEVQAAVAYDAMVDLIRADDRAERAALLNLIRDLADPDDCWFDHHGGCHAHGYLSLGQGEKCPQYEAKELLAQEGGEPDGA